MYREVTRESLCVDSILVANVGGDGVRNVVVDAAESLARNPAFLCLAGIHRRCEQKPRQETIARSETKSDNRQQRRIERL